MANRDITPEELTVTAAVSQRWTEHVKKLRYLECTDLLLRIRNNLDDFTIRTLMGERPWEDEEKGES